jgi:putative endonuclease
MSSVRLALGKSGEDLACAELKRRGYAIIARRHRSRLGELDIIARDGSTMVFVEVKARASGSCGDPVEAVTPAKRRRIVRLALEYLWLKGLVDRPCRFDVVAIRVEEGRPRVEVYRGAFDASL